ncbi:IS110 family transposase [Mycolicibacterium peregrinum]|uniref:IS110 family transposase n=1 Tax=Mycolicibacterium peregrinum TaxID=43304 RepID=UPI0006D7E9A4|nr:IS110 family transposase [Mycolicibacterium peregrinum]MCV7202764.1 IS110 family transposase [Mycolicibacterium peregrinum]ORW51249.1 transposase [Mycolicibacterium peregrinum]OWL93283.1 IS110 family transposase [Mycolicibacterium peregrinum]
MTESVLVVAGADTHADTMHVAAISMTGAVIGDREFPTTRTGYAAAIRFLTSLGQVERIGVEGTASYGAGFTRVLTAAGIEVVEVTRAVKSTRRLKGKSDPLDAYSAARTALAGDGLATPKDDATAGLRALHIARRSAVKHRTAVINQIKAMLVSAPDVVREKYRGLTTLKLIEALARCRPDAQVEPWAQSLLVAAKLLAQRVQFLETQAEALEAQIDALVTEANPGLRAAYGVGADTAAQLLITAGANPHRLHSEAAFAALCGVAPVPASSGKTNRHRLSRGGDRAANNALHRVALVRLSHHQPTKDYAQSQLNNGHSKSRMEVLRKLKRAIAREIFKLLTRQIAVPDYADLRPVRQAKNITVTAAANHFGVWPTVISRIERGLQRDDSFAETYRHWLQIA